MFFIRFVMDYWLLSDIFFFCLMSLYWRLCVSTPEILLYFSLQHPLQVDIYCTIKIHDLFIYLMLWVLGEPKLISADLLNRTFVKTCSLETRVCTRYHSDYNIRRFHGNFELPKPQGCLVNILKDRCG